MIRLLAFQRNAQILQRTPVLRVLAALIAIVALGNVLALSYYNHFARVYITNRLDQIVTLIYLTLFFSCVSYVGVWRVCVPLLSDFRQRAKLIWLVSTFSAATFLLVVFPDTVPAGNTPHRLEIIAIGQQNPTAQGREVWLTGITLSNGSQVAFTDIQHEGDWELRDNALVAFKQTPAVLHWQGVAKGVVRVTFVSHPWSGIVRLRWNGSLQDIDLYASEQGSRTVELLDTIPITALTQWSVRSSVAFIADIGSLSFVLLLAGLWFAQQSTSVRRVVSTRSWPWWLYSLPCIIVWSAYLLAFWPAIMTNDSLDQWNQVLTGKFHNIHPAFHTMTNWLVTRIWLSPAMVALAQIIALSGVFGLTMGEFEQWGVPRWTRVMTTTVFCLSIVNGLMVITLWKDVPYTIVMLGFFLVILRMLRTRLEWLRTRQGVLVLWIIVLLLSLYRHNGTVLVPLALGVFAISFVGKVRLHIFAIGVVWVVAFGLITIPLYTLLRVETIPAVVRHQIQIHQVAALLQEKNSLSVQDEQLLESLQPLDVWRKSYTCYTQEPLMYNGKLDWTVVDQKSSQFVRLWLKLVINHPIILLRHQLCVNSMIWRISLPNDGYMSIPPYTIGVDTNNFQLAHRSQWREFEIYIVQLVGTSLKSPYIWWLWRPALYLYIGLFCALVLAVRYRSKHMLLIALPTFLNSFILFFLINTQDFRFQYPTYVIGLIMPALLFSKLKRETMMQE